MERELTDTGRRDAIVSVSTREFICQEFSTRLGAIYDSMVFQSLDYTARKCFFFKFVNLLLYALTRQIIFLYRHIMSANIVRSVTIDGM